jgi:hypothetical protein
MKYFYCGLTANFALTVQDAIKTLNTNVSLASLLKSKTLKRFFTKVDGSDACVGFCGVHALFGHDVLFRDKDEKEQQTYLVERYMDIVRYLVCEEKSLRDIFPRFGNRDVSSMDSLKKFIFPYVAQGLELPRTLWLSDGMLCDYAAHVNLIAYEFTDKETRLVGKKVHERMNTDNIWILHVSSAGDGHFDSYKFVESLEQAEVLELMQFFQRPKKVKMKRKQKYSDDEDYFPERAKKKRKKKRKKNVKRRRRNN